MSLVPSTDRTIKQYVATKKGGPFQVVTAPYPEPGPDKICIRNRAVALNPIDWKRLHHGVMVERWPEILGIDTAGVVEAVGKNVTDFKPRDAVMSLAGFGGYAGAFQDVKTVPAHFASKKPEKWTFEEAASVPLVYLTATAALTKGLGLSLPHLQVPIHPFALPNLSNDPDILQYTLNSPLTPTTADAVSRAQEQAISRGPISNYPFPDSDRAPQPTTPSADGSNGNHRHHHHHSRQPTTSAEPRKRISSVLVLGGASDVGAATIQLLRGALPECTIVSSNSPRHNGRLTAELGATACVERNGGGGGGGGCTGSHNRCVAELVEAVRAACRAAAAAAAAGAGAGAGSTSGEGGGDDGVDAIVDAVGVVEAAESEEEGQGRLLLDLLAKDGPRVYATVATAGRQKMVDLPEGVRETVVSGRMAFLAGDQGGGGMEVMKRLGALVEEGRFALPVEVEVVGTGFEAISEGLEKLRREGVSGVKLVVQL
ncbi:hypothetical protein MFIFM68171_10258 [Madurella fahalii]|uniref:Enoyl reductase (ER) domain-containing protein n=1 Tax=Madurella fahalii TaxID=1157608 RepID=A0ABQ0GQN5_9PEZI